jgi:hypothetical protein
MTDKKTGSPHPRGTSPRADGASSTAELGRRQEWLVGRAFAGCKVPRAQRAVHVDPFRFDDRFVAAILSYFS